jgi:Arc/MetJ-type ribon-helix-helix transcriptional regulator
MTLTLPTETEQLIAEQVRSGRFPTPEAVVAAAAARLADGPQPPAGDDDAVWDESLDAEDRAAIAEPDAEAERGDVLDSDAFRAELAKWAVPPR